MVPLVSTNGTIGNTIGTNGNANGTIGPPNGTIGTNGKPMVSQWYHWLPMVPLVKFPMVPLGKPRTHAMQCTPGLAFSAQQLGSDLGFYIYPGFYIYDPSFWVNIDFAKTTQGWNNTPWK